jgi:hypothetical protein
MLPAWSRKMISQHSTSTKRGRTGSGLQARYLLRLEPLEDRVVLTTFTVTNTLDSALGPMSSLRWAINQANNDPAGGDTIEFNIPISKLKPITVNSALPPIMRPNTTIDGTSQPGFADTHTPQIEIDGSGLDIQAGSCSVTGLVIDNDKDYKTAPDGNLYRPGIYLEENGNNTIAGNYLGTDKSGAALPGSQEDVGVLISGSSKNTIGGTTSDARNVISGNFIYGVYIDGNSDRNLVQGNYIGTDFTGMSRVPGRHPHGHRYVQ